MRHSGVSGYAGAGNIVYGYVRNAREFPGQAAYAVHRRRPQVLQSSGLQAVVDPREYVFAYGGLGVGLRGLARRLRPVFKSTRLQTMFVVPRSTASPKLLSRRPKPVDRSGSTSISSGSLKNPIVAVISKLFSRSASGSLRTTPMGTFPTLIPLAPKTCQDAFEVRGLVVIRGGLKFQEIFFRQAASSVCCRSTGLPHYFPHVPHVVSSKGGDRLAEL